MPAESQSQARLMNWVHAVQSGEAKGSGKVNEIAKEMKPSSVEHFMNRGHIDKSLPEKVSSFTDYLQIIKQGKALTLPNKHLSTKGVNKHELEEGVEEEHEHTQNNPVAKQIALDHLKEDKKYYTHLEAMEHRYGTEKEHHHELKQAGLQNYMMEVNAGKTKKIKTINREEPTIKKAFELGFMKAALASGMDALTAVNMLKKAVEDKSNEDKVKKRKPNYALGCIGLGAGAIGSALAMATDHPQPTHHLNFNHLLTE